MTIMERLTAQLHRAAQHVPGEELASAQDAVNRLRDTFAQVVGNDEQRDAQAVLGELQQASNDLSAAMVRARQVVDALDSFARYVGIAPSGRTLPESPVVVGSEPVGPAVAKQPPERVRDAGRRLPVRVRRADRTTGEFNGETIVSGRDRTSTADLVPSPQGGWPEVLLFHGESHVAARMRREELTDGELILNNVTCGNRGYDNDWPVTCERYLRSILPTEARLTVWATQDGGQSWWSRTYVGTGERIKP